MGDDWESGRDGPLDVGSPRDDIGGGYGYVVGGY